MPLFDVEVAGRETTTLAVKVVEQVAHHQMARVHLRGVVSVPEGTPVRIQWGTSTARRTFVGYVNHRDEDASGRLHDTHIVCVGATRPLKAARHRIWHEATLNRVVQDVARDYWLAADVEDDGYTTDVTQSGDVSTWQFLAQQCSDAGYMLVPNATRLQVFDPVLRLRQTMTRAPVYTRNPYTSFGPIRDVRATVGTESGRGGERPSRRLFGVDSAGRVIGAYHKDDGFERSPAKAIRSAADLPYIVSREARRQQLAHQIELTVGGYANHLPGESLGMSGYADDVNGYWIIERAMHDVRLDRYEVSLRASRALDRSGEALPVPRVRSFSLRTAQKEGRSQQAPRSRLVGDTWRAA